MWRELWQMRGQVLAIVLVIAGGVAVAVMSLSTYTSLLEGRDNFYRDYGFADVFAELKRAPLPVLENIRQIDGVRKAEPSILAHVNLIVPGLDDPATGLMVSFDDKHHLNRLHLVQGRLCQPGNDHEVVIGDGFAEANKLEPGDTFTAIINGHKKVLRVTGIALSPAYIYQIEPGAVFPDFRRFGVMWMDAGALAKAYDMEGAFNSLSLVLERGAKTQSIINRVDHVLSKWGGQGAYDREDQLSNRFLKEEFLQLKTMAYLFPLIFLSVAMFLLYVVLARMVSVQKPVIAVLKAFGYSNLQVGVHYLGMVLLIAIMGLICGVLGGIWLGRGMTVLYSDYYRFPEFVYRVDGFMLVAVCLIILVIVTLSTFKGVLRAASLPPAEAMRPEMPEVYSASWLDTVLLKAGASQPLAMIARNLQRNRIRSLMTVAGLAMACAILMVGNFQQDAVRHMVAAQFELAQKQDMEVNLVEPVADKELSVFRGLPGVYEVEGLRYAPVKIHYRNNQFRTSLSGMDDDARLKAVLDADLQPVRMPAGGVLVTEHLAAKLGFSVGDEIWIEMLEGNRQMIPVRVSALITEYLGLGVYMNRQSMNALLLEGPAFNSVLLRMDAPEKNKLQERLRDIPGVASINLRETVVSSFRETLDRILLTFTLINALLGGVIAFGVVYNTVRIALAERQRELASLRVLGYRLDETAFILFGELLVLLLLGIPAGFLLGEGLCAFLVEGMQTDLYRVPLILSTYTFSFSAMVVIVSALFSALLVWFKLQSLDLVEALKTRE